MMILLPAAAEAQGQRRLQTPPPLPSLLIPLEPPETAPASGTQGGYFFNLRPLGADFGRTLADHGIYLQAKNLTEGLDEYDRRRQSGHIIRGIFHTWI